MLDAGYTPKKSTGLATIMVLYQGPKMDQGHEPCSFTDKALNAQKAGADAVLIASYTEQLYMAVVKETDKEYQKAQDVTATVGMIRASAAKALTDQISGGKKLLMQLDWTSVFPRTKIVEWELWDSSEDNCGAKCDMEQEFTREFAPIARTLEMGEWTHFSPHYLTWLCPEGYEGSADCVSIKASASIKAATATPTLRRTSRRATTAATSCRKISGSSACLSRQRRTTSPGCGGTT